MSSRKNNDSLNKKKNPNNRKDLLDYDYLHKLNKEELDYLNTFTEEYAHANFDKKKKEKRIHPLSKVNSKTKKNRVYDKFKKEAEDNNNSRNRDIMNIEILRTDMTNNKEYLEKLLNVHEDIEKEKNVLEDAIIDELDNE